MGTSTAREQARQFLQAQMHRYQTSQLVSVRPDEFRKNIEMFLRMNDGYEDVTVSQVIEARSLAAGTRHRHGDMMRGGLSVRAIW
jgi:hypothetical protein